MRHLVLGCDGTWNRPDQMDRGRQVPTNVVKILRAVDENATAVTQIKYYDTGVGTGGFLDHLIGGLTGLGLLRNVCEAYHWLLAHYRDGDRIFLFGFSRGAFTARCLAALIGLLGIPRAAEGRAWPLARAAVRIYRMRRRDRRLALARSWRSRHASRSARVHFLGVWDTVGALGLPVPGPLGWWSRRLQGFHDTALGSHVTHAFHALAIDERRRPFAPTLWEGPAPAGVERVMQCWFPGVHSNVGGGYVDAGLSDRALLWMICRAREAGLVFNPHYLARRIDPNWFGERRRSLGLVYRLLGPRRRRIGTPGTPGECIHFSALERWRSPTAPEPMPVNLRQALEAGVPVWKDPTGGERNFHEKTPFAGSQTDKVDPG